MTRKDDSKKHSSVNNCTTDGDKDRKNSHDCYQTGLCQKNLLYLDLVLHVGSTDAVPNL